MDISRVTTEELPAIATRNLAECCDLCREMLRERLEDEEYLAGQRVDEERTLRPRRHS